MEDEATIPEAGTALNVNEAADMIGGILDVPEDSNEHTEEHVEDTTDTDEVAVETPDDTTYFDVNGEQVSLDDLQKGYLRQADYTRKTQEIAEQRKHYTENQRDINALRSEALQGLEALKQHVSAEFRLMEIPNWDELAQDDPGEYVRQQALWAKRENAVRQIFEAEAALKEKAEAYEKEQHEAALKESNAKFFEKYPELRDATKSKEVFSEITGYLMETGFSKEEIEGISDYRIVDLLYQNVQARKAQQSIPNVVAKIEKKPVLSAKETSRKTDFNQANYDKFKNSRNVNDAAALIKNLL